ncbi:MAG: chemoreceptor glutamine deamidase CheD [Alphaproteobacteria bacterium]|nr:chemoreceptor glutamine deamidase CheD [Alphaproteobacteria bacterium]
MAEENILMRDPIKPSGWLAMRGKFAGERRARQERPVLDYFQGGSHFYDASQKMTVVKIFFENWHVSGKRDEMLAAVLGSCVSVCMRDPALGVGGMNHFLLPDEDYADSRVSASARYGAFVMECLINGLLASGAQKDRLEVKLFGGGNVVRDAARAGSMNAQFIRSYLRKEGFRILSEDLEGDYFRRLSYYPESGRVVLRQLRRKEDQCVLDEEARYARQIRALPIEGAIDLFQGKNAL